MNSPGFHEVHIFAQSGSRKLKRLRSLSPHLRLNTNCDPRNIPAGSMCFEYPAGVEHELDRLAAEVGLKIEWGIVGVTFTCCFGLGNLLFAGDNNGAIHSWDISNPASPSALDTFSLGGAGIVAIWVDQSVLYALDGAGMLSGVNFENPAALALYPNAQLATGQGFEHMKVAGVTAFCSGEGATVIGVYDVGVRPFREILLIGDTGAGFSGSSIAVRGRRMYFGDASGSPAKLRSFRIGGFFCFGGEQEFLTPEGLVSFREAQGTARRVLAGDGKWREAEIRSFGLQSLCEIEMRPGKYSISSTRITVRATLDHRWVTANRGEVRSLRINDLIPFRPPADTVFHLEGFLRGFGYGDGTIEKKRGRARILLYGEKAKYLGLFQQYGSCFVSYPPSFNGQPLVVFNGGAMRDWKNLPNGDEGADFISNWIEGLLCADGHKHEDGITLSMQDEAAIDFVSKFAPLAGYMVRGRSISKIDETNYGKRKSPLVTLRLRAEGVWQVVSIKTVEEKEEVFCAVEPVTSLFTLAGGVLTGNCQWIATQELHVAGKMNAEEVRARHLIARGEVHADELSVVGGKLDTDTGSGSFANYIKIGSIIIAWGTGDPTGVYTLPQGSEFHRTDGAAGSTLYYNFDGTNTGWSAVA